MTGDKDSSSVQRLDVVSLGWRRRCTLAAPDRSFAALRPQVPVAVRLWAPGLPWDRSA